MKSKPRFEMKKLSAVVLKETDGDTMNPRLKAELLSNCIGDFNNHYCPVKKNRTVCP